MERARARHRNICYRLLVNSHKTDKQEKDTTIKTIREKFDKYKHGVVRSMPNSTTIPQLKAWKKLHGALYSEKSIKITFRSIYEVFGDCLIWE